MTDQELDILLSEEFQNYLKEDPFEFELTEEVLNEGKFLNAIRWKLAKFSLRFLSNKSLDDFFTAYYAKNGQPTEESKKACDRSRREKIKHIRLLCDKLPQEVKDRIIQSPQAKQCEKAAAVSGISTAITGAATGLTVARAAQATTNYFAAKEAAKAKQMELQKKDSAKEDTTKEKTAEEDTQKKDIDEEKTTDDDSTRKNQSKQIDPIEQRYIYEKNVCTKYDDDANTIQCCFRSDGTLDLEDTSAGVEMLENISADNKIALNVAKSMIKQYCFTLGFTSDHDKAEVGWLNSLQLKAEENPNAYYGYGSTYSNFTKDMVNSVLHNIKFIGKNGMCENHPFTIYSINLDEITEVLKSINGTQFPAKNIYGEVMDDSHITTEIPGLSEDYNSTFINGYYLIEKVNKNSIVTGAQLFGSALSVLASFIFPQLWAVWIVAGIQTMNTGIGIARTGSMAHKATTIRRDEIVGELMKNKDELKESIFHTEGMNLLMEQTMFEDVCESNANVAATLASALINKIKPSAPETILTIRNDRIVKNICDVNEFVQNSTREFGRAAFSKKVSLREAILSVFKLNLVLGTKYSLHDVFQDASIKSDTESTFVEYSKLDFSKVIAYRDALERSATTIRHCLFDNLFDKATLTKYLPTLYFIACT